MKQCIKCKITKSKDCFHKDRTKKDGLRGACKSCVKQYQKENKNKISEYMKQYCKKHRQTILEYKKRYYQENKEVLAEKQKQYQEENKEAIAKYQKQYREVNKKAQVERMKQWYEANKEYLIKYYKQYRTINREVRIEHSKQYHRLNKEVILEKKRQYSRFKALFDTYATQIDWVEEVSRDPRNNELLQVKCTNSECNRWFNPTNQEVRNRINALNSINGGELRFYCSNECKQSCSIFYQKEHPKGFRNTDNDRLDQAEWATMVKERDGYQCVRCGRDDLPLIAHHIEGLNVNPLESADIDIGITLCEECDKLVHSEEGCRYSDLRKDQLCKESY